MYLTCESGRVATRLKLSQYFPTNFWKRVQRPLLISKPHPSLWLLLSHGSSCCCNLCWPWPRKHNPGLLQLLKVVVPQPNLLERGMSRVWEAQGKISSSQDWGGTHHHVVIAVQHPGDPDRSVCVLCFLCCWTSGTKVWGVQVPQFMTQCMSVLGQVPFWLSLFITFITNPNINPLRSP